MVRRATILILATVVSLGATQPAPVRTSRSQDVPAIIWLAESRAEKAVKLKIQRPPFSSDFSTHHFVRLSLDGPQIFSAAAGPRAPPVSPV